VLDDPARVADHIAVEHQQRDPTLAAQRLNFGASRPTLWNRHGREFDSIAGESAGHLATGAEPV
jgi:hypothetical protein